MWQILTAAIILGANAVQDSGLVAHWPFDSDFAEKVADTGPDGIEGVVSGAQRAACKEGYALLFDAGGAHVDCGNPPSLDITGAITLEAWVYPTARANSETGIAGKSFDTYGLTFYSDGNFYWYIGSGGNKCSSQARISRWNHVAGTFDGKTLSLYLNGERVASHDSQFSTNNHGGNFLIGRIMRSASVGGPTDSFEGYIDGVRVYGRALAEAEILAHYEEAKAGYPRMEKGLDRIALTPYYYFDEGKLFADVDFGTLAPFGANDTAEVTLWREGASEPVFRLAPFGANDAAEIALWREGTPEPIFRMPIDTVPELGVLQDLEVDIAGIEPGRYELRATYKGEDGTGMEDKASFAYPGSPPLPSPGEHVAPALPAQPDQPSFACQVNDAGGFRLRIGSDVYEVESAFSYPHGGENILGDGSGSTAQESGWRVATEETSPNVHRVKAEGAFYTIDREIGLEAHRAVIRDRITNKTNEPLGILLSNHIRADSPEGLTATQYANPTIFLAREALGIGIAALDDVYLEHHEAFYEDGIAGIRDHHFALDAGASYTLEWAVYFNATGDYYDFINAVRRDEGLVRTVDGGFAFTDRREPPTEDFVRFRALKYASLPCLSHAADDEGISIEGIEFTEYPEECRLLKETFAETKRRFPDLEVMFHIAHSLYATAKPDELFPGSRTLDSSGRQTDYGNNNVAYYERYFSKKNVAEGYRWFIFYPAADNAFGKAMLEATDYMLDEIGVTGMFGDGLTHGYGGRFTYDRWDGHTAEIDPETKTIKRTYASVNLLADPVLIDVVGKIHERDGVVIANSYPGTRTFHREDVIYCIETGGGDKNLSRLYLCPTVIALGDPTRIACERDVYKDIRDKLEWGSLYFFYGEGVLTHPTLTTHMYPITVEDLRPGIITGRERIITTRPGVYGWPGENDLHIAHRYDGRGVLAQHDFVTTVDADGIRTALALGAHDTAVVVKMPMTVDAPAPVNLRVCAYDEDGLRFLANGTGEARVTIRSGRMAVAPGQQFIVRQGDREEQIAAQDNLLNFTVPLVKLVEVSVMPVR